MKLKLPRLADETCPKIHYLAGMVNKLVEQLNSANERCRELEAERNELESLMGKYDYLVTEEGMYAIIKNGIRSLAEDGVLTINTEVLGELTAENKSDN